MSVPRDFNDLDTERLIAFVADAFRRQALHHAAWFRETEKLLGTEGAFAIEEKAWERSLGIQMDKLGRAAGFAVEGGLPAALRGMDRKRLLALLDALSTGWLVGDGLWFQAVEQTEGMDAAKTCNDAAWGTFSPFEARRILKLLGLESGGGLEVLETALAFRLYARINEQECRPDEDGALLFRMINCRVQSARRRKGLADYPCKSAGVIEYSSFARAIDPRIVTTCLACPPDALGADEFCSWRFTLGK